MRGVTGTVVVITGASSGIGRETARMYAKKGARLVLASRSQEALETVAKECRELGGQALVVTTDVASEGEVRALAATAVLEFGHIDVWVGNAGVFAYGAFEHLPADVFRQVVETNLMGQVHGARAVLPYFRRQGSGTLVMVGSLYSRVGSPVISPYVTSKWGLAGFAECLRQELRGSGIRVRMVMPGTIDTPIYQHAANVTTRHIRPLPPATSPKRVARAIVKAPQRRRYATYVGRLQKQSLPVHDLAPAAYDAAATRAVEQVELQGEGAEVTVGNVLDTPDAASPTTGGWRSPGARLALSAIAAAALSTLLVARRRPQSVGS
jgi:short-subunit dehydrogenase